MDITTLLIATALAMDSFSVALANGLATKSFNISKGVMIGSFFGFFQAIMPVIGWYAGVHILDLISEIDHWVAFALLAIIGSRMIYESTKNDSEKIVSSLNIRVLLILSIATSIDAAAVGLSFAALNIPILFPALIIGMVCFIFSGFGLFLGHRIGLKIGKWAERFGGFILVILGIKIFLQHVL